MSSREMVLGYAFLKATVAFENIRSPLDALDALALRATIRVTRKRFRASSLQSAIKDVWGLQVPELVCQSALSRLESKGHLVIEENKQSGAYEYIPNVDPGVIKAIMDREGEAKTLIDRLNSKIEKYIKADMPQTTLRASDIIEQWLDTSALALMSDNFRYQPISETDKENNRIISRMMGILSSLDNDFIDDMTTLALGDAVYKSIKNLTEFEFDDTPVGTADRLPMAKVDVYLDTPVVLKLLGFFGLRNVASASEFKEMCISTGCQLCIFEHTVDECVEGILGVARRLRPGSESAFGPIVAYALEEGLDASDLISRATGIRKEIEDNGIFIKPTPDQAPALTIDERDLDAQLEREVQQTNEFARQRDIASLTAIYRLREGAGFSYLEKCKAIFITSNRSLASSSARYFSKIFQDSGINNSVQICMTDVIFSVRLWTKLPTLATKTPRLQILGHAIGNLTPSHEVRQKFRKILDELVKRNYITDESAVRIEYSEFARLALAMDIKGADDLTLSKTRNIIMGSIAEQQAMIRASSAAQIEVSLRDAKAEIERLKLELLTLKDGNNNSADATTAKALDAFEDEVLRGQSTVDIAGDFAGIMAAMFIILITFLIIAGVIFIILKDIGYSAFLSYKLDAPSNIIIRSVATVFLTVLTLTGLSAAGIFKPTRDFIKTRLILPMLFR